MWRWAPTGSPGGPWASLGVSRDYSAPLSRPVGLSSSWMMAMLFINTSICLLQLSRPPVPSTLQHGFLDRCLSLLIVLSF
jgi:hypothetical protein